MNHRVLFLTAYPILWLVIWAVLGLATVAMWPALPVFDLPVLAQAWDMWRSDSFLMSAQSGATDNQAVYPLYLWFIHASWGLFGVSDTWPRLLPFALGFGCSLMTAALARALWPGWAGLGVLSATVSMGMIGWSVAAGLSGETVLLVLCILVALFGLVSAWRRGAWDGILLLGLGLGLGFLTSGFAVLAYVLPVAVLSPFWAPALGWAEVASEGEKQTGGGWRQWYVRLLIALAIGIAIIAAWLVLLGRDSGFQAALDVLTSPILDLFQGNRGWGQHWWLYLGLLAAFLLPWVVWPPAWRALGGLWSLIKDGGGRFCLIWLVVPLALFVVLPDSRPLDVALHVPALAMMAAYLLYLRLDPEMARQETERRFGNGEATLGLMVALLGLALIILPLAGGLLSLPWWIEGLSGAWGGVLILIAAIAAYAAPQMIIFRATLVMCQMVLVVLVGIMAASPLLMSQADITPAADRVRQMLDQDTAVAVAGRLDRDMSFPSRLEAPLDVLDPSDSIGVVAWAAGHPGGEIVIFSENLPSGEKPTAVFPYLNQYLVFWSVETVAAQPDLVLGQGLETGENLPESGSGTP